MKLTQEQIDAIKTKLSLTPAQGAQLRRELDSLAAKADETTDNLLAKIAKSKWSWAIALGIIAAAWLLGYVL